MTSKIGPLPVWAWVGIPAAGYVLFSYYRASQAPETVEPPSVGGSAGTAEEDYGINTGGSYLPSYGAAPNGTSNLPVPTETPEFNNQSWFRTVSNWLIGEGVPSTDVVTALNAYLYGTPEEITATQGDALQRALMKYGAAPDPAFIPKITPAPAPAPVDTEDYDLYRDNGNNMVERIPASSLTAAEVAAGKATRNGKTYLIVPKATAIGLGLN